MTDWGPITEPEALRRLTAALEVLRGIPVHYLRVPADMAMQIEPSQVGTIVGTLTDLMLPRFALEQGIGLTKAAGLRGEREDYPDFEHAAGYRIELKGAFADNASVKMKKPRTPREASARLTQKVTVKNVVPERDALLVLVYQLEPLATDPTLLSPTIKHVGVFPAIECIRARDHRMIIGGGRWFGNYETPAILSRIGRKIRRAGEVLDVTRYGRKEGEGWHFNEDTNFGKMMRIPYRPLQEFLRDSGCAFTGTGSYPTRWAMSKEDQELALPLEMAGEDAAE